MKIEVGDLLVLQNLSFQNWFCSSRSKEWDNILMANFFNHVTLWFPRLEKRGERAKTFFDQSVTQVTKVVYDGVDDIPVEVYTDLFWIHFPHAISSGEVLIWKNSKLPKWSSLCQKLVSDLEFIEEEYSSKVFDIFERENCKYDAYRRSFAYMREVGKWKGISRPGSLPS